MAGFISCPQLVQIQLRKRINVILQRIDLFLTRENRSIIEPVSRMIRIVVYCRFPFALSDTLAPSVCSQRAHRSLLRWSYYGEKSMLEHEIRFARADVLLHRERTGNLGLRFQSNANPMWLDPNHSQVLSFHLPHQAQTDEKQKARATYRDGAAKETLQS